MWIAAIALVFWLLIIRPASKRQKEIAALQSSLSVGDEVILTSGVFATVTEITDDHLAVEIAPGVVIRVARGAVASVRQEAAQAEDTTEPAAGQATDATPDDTEER
ncbi:preprotein translocase subunit YajC [Nocardioides sp.]|nr:preprotein translocase subunit YajC [Nocardioides sp.]